MTLDDIPMAVREWWLTLFDAPGSRGGTYRLRKSLMQDAIDRAPDGAVLAVHGPSPWFLMVKRDGGWVDVEGRRRRVCAVTTAARATRRFEDYAAAYAFEAAA